MKQSVKDADSEQLACHCAQIAAKVLSVFVAWCVENIEYPSVFNSFVNFGLKVVKVV